MQNKIKHVYQTQNPFSSLFQGKYHSQGNIVSVAVRSVNILHSVIFFLLRNDGTEFGGSIYQKVNDKLETAVNLAWTAGNSNTRFGIAAKYQIDPDASFSVSSVLPKE